MLRPFSGKRRLASLGGTPGEKFSQEETRDKKPTRQTELEFVYTVSAGGSVKFLPAV